MEVNDNPLKTVLIFNPSEIIPYTQVVHFSSTLSANHVRFTGDYNEEKPLIIAFHDDFNFKNGDFTQPTTIQAPKNTYFIAENEDLNINAVVFFEREDGEGFEDPIHISEILHVGEAPKTDGTSIYDSIFEEKIFENSDLYSEQEYESFTNRFSKPLSSELCEFAADCK